MGLFQKISTHTLGTTLNWVPKTFRISKKANSSFCRIPNLGDSKAWGIPEFCKTFNGLRGIPVKIQKVWRKFMDFQSGSPSICYKISNVVHGERVDIFWNSPIPQGEKEYLLYQVCRNMLTYLKFLSLILCLRCHQQLTNH